MSKQKIRTCFLRVGGVSCLLPLCYAVLSFPARKGFTDLIASCTAAVFLTIFELLMQPKLTFLTVALCLTHSFCFLPSPSLLFCSFPVSVRTLAEKTGHVFMQLSEGAPWSAIGSHLPLLVKEAMCGCRSRCITFLCPTLWLHLRAEGLIFVSCFPLSLLEPGLSVQVWACFGFETVCPLYQLH